MAKPKSTQSVIYGMLSKAVSEKRKAPKHSTIAASVGISINDVPTYLNALVVRGLIQIEGPGGNYRVCINGKWSRTSKSANSMGEDGINNRNCKLQDEIMMAECIEHGRQIAEKGIVFEDVTYKHKGRTPIRIYSVPHTSGGVAEYGI